MLVSWPFALLRLYVFMSTSTFSCNSKFSFRSGVDFRKCLITCVFFFLHTVHIISISLSLQTVRKKIYNDSCCIYPVCRLQLPKLELLKMIDILSIPAKTSSDGRFSLPLQQLQRVINDALQSLINYAFLSPWSQTWLA